MTTKVSVERNLVGLEDMAFGVGTITQSRGGTDVQITKINAQNLPFDETRDLKKALEDEKAMTFAMFGINNNGELIATYAEENVFSLNDKGEFVIEYNG